MTLDTDAWFEMVEVRSGVAIEAAAEALPHASRWSTSGHRTHEMRHGATVLVSVVVLSNCAWFGSGTAQGSPAAVASVVVSPSNKPAEKRNLLSEIVPQNNCSGSSQVSATIERTLTFTHTVDLGTDISVSANGTAGIPGVGQVQVGTQVALHYGVSYGSQESITRSITLSAAAGSNIQHKIQQYEEWETGTLKIVSGGSTSSFPYSFRRSAGVDLVSSDPLPCPLNAAAVRPLAQEFSARLDIIEQQVAKSNPAHPGNPTIITSSAQIVIYYNLNGNIPVQKDFTLVNLEEIVLRLENIAPQAALTKAHGDVVAFRSFMDALRQPPGQYDFPIADPATLNALLANLDQDRQTINALGA